MTKQYSQQTLQRLLTEAQTIDVGQKLQINAFAELIKQIIKGNALKF